MKSTLRSLIVLFAILTVIPTMVVAQGYPGPVELEFRNAPDAPESGHDCTTNPDNPFTNCSFETGDLTGWVVTDAQVPLIAVQVVPAGAYAGYGFFSTAPTQGALSAVHGFDSFGGPPDSIEMAQDITVPTGDIVTMEFDYRGAWDLQTFGATLDRTFDVEVQPAGGGASMQTDNLLTAAAGTLVTDTGVLSGLVDLTPYAGQSVRVAFRWTIPEAGVGPAFFEADNFDVTSETITNSVDVPAQSTIGLVILFAALLGAAVFTLRQRG